jgi:hypothetical protein
MQHADGCRHARQNIAMEPENYYDGPMNGIANFVAGVFHGAGRGPAPAATPVQQNHIHQQPAVQMPAPQNQLALGLGRDFLNNNNVQVQNRGFGGWMSMLRSSNCKRSF